MSTVYFRGTDNTLWAVNWDPVTGQASGQSAIMAPNGKPNTTSSTPFVVPGVTVDRVYFRGTDNTLWTVNWDTVNLVASGQSAILAPNGKPNTTSSTPFVLPGQPLFGGGNEPDRVYFQGTDNALWYVNSDGSGQMRVPTSIGGPNTTRSSPFVINRFPEADNLYFQGTDNTLWFLGWVPGEATSDQFQIGSNTTKSSPFVIPGEYVALDQVYFRGTNDKLWVVLPDGSGLTQIGDNKTRNTPYVVKSLVGYQDQDINRVYFQGTNNDLWVWNDELQTVIGSQNGSGGNKTKSSPFATQDGFVYFQGTDNTLWSVRTDGELQSPIPAPFGNPNTTSSSPFVIER